MKTACVENWHLLFVDDDSDETYLFNEALEHSGGNLQLSRAKDGIELIKFLQSKHLPDLVLIDLNMPYKDGLEALKEIRQDMQLVNLPLVIYSTSDNLLHIDQSFENKASLYIVKPDSFNGMVEVINYLCSVDWKNFNQPSRDGFLLTFE